MSPRLALPLLIALGACTTVGDLPTARLGDARLTFANGLPAGTAQLLSNGDGVTLAVAVTGMAPGAKGFHLHTAGRCEGPDFTSAGGHLNPAGREHGSLNPRGKHLGDMPNLDVGAARTAAAEVDLTGTRDTLLADIFDGDGTAVIVHANADDYTSDPAGNAGARIACGVLRRAG